MHLRLFIYLIGLIAMVCIPAGAQTASLGLIPYPASVVRHPGVLHLSEHITVSGEQSTLARLSEVLQPFTQAHPSLSWSYTAGKGTAHIQLSKQRQSSPEAYRLVISEQGIQLTASTEIGLIRGATTLLQLLEAHRPTSTQSTYALPCLTIEDSPRLPLRALMLDPARHFLPIADLRRYIDQMVYYKYNTLQLHLTDDQGWRLAVDGLPQLTQIHEGNERKSRAYYTAQELKELVQYAQRRGVEIIPEIDVPGHTAAMLIAMPELRTDILRDSTLTLGKSQKVMLSATAPQTYEVLDKVMGSLRSIFGRNARIHLGGDEAEIEANWGRSPEHLALMKQLGLQKPRELMGYFFARVLALARKHDLRPMLWCELDNIRLPATEYLFPYPEDVALITWRMGLTPKCVELTRQSGHPLILAPGESAYLDYPQGKNDLPEWNNWGMPITTLERSYHFDLNTPTLSGGDLGHIIGIMGTLWGEAIPSIDRAFYMTYPRALALAEIGWTPLQSRDYQRFLSSLPSVLSALMLRGIPYRTPYESYR